MAHPARASPDGLARLWGAPARNPKAVASRHLRGLRRRGNSCEAELRAVGDGQ